MALNGFGVWSLIVRIYIYEIIRSFCFLLSKWIPSKPTFMVYGQYLILVFICLELNYLNFSNNLITIIVGKHFMNTGAYNVAHNCVQASTVISKHDWNILFTGFSKIQNDF